MKGLRSRVLVVKDSLFVELLIDVSELLFIDQVKVLLRKVDIVQLLFQGVDRAAWPTTNPTLGSFLVNSGCHRRLRHDLQG